MSIREKLKQMGLEPTAAMGGGAGRPLPFVSVRVRGKRACISGHLPLNTDGSLSAPLGKVGAEVSVEQAVEAARKVVLAMLGSLERELGDLETVVWVRVFGMVNAAPGFTQTPIVINGCSELILALFGSERGAHSRSAIGVAELPFNVPVEIEAEVELV